jgi:hypothetical protein
MDCDKIFGVEKSKSYGRPIAFKHANTTQALNLPYTLTRLADGFGPKV